MLSDVGRCHFSMKQKYLPLISFKFTAEFSFVCQRVWYFFYFVVDWFSLRARGMIMILHVCCSVSHKEAVIVVVAIVCCKHNWFPM